MSTGAVVGATVSIISAWAEVAAANCRVTGYSTPNRAALPLLPAELRANPAVFPPADVLDRLELLRDLGPATALYDRLWTEVKSEGE